MLPIVLIAFVASLVGSTFGFGEALVGVPLLSLVISIRLATPLAVLISITISACVVFQDWRDIHLRSAAWLLVPGVAGIPLGIAVLESPSQRLVKAALAVAILAYSGYCLLGSLPPAVGGRRRWMLACGLVAGVFGGAFGMNGPPLAIYGAMRRWSPQRFRATLQGYFLPASVVAMAGYGFAGLWVPALMRDFLICLPAVVAAVVLGRVANRRLREGPFMKLVHVGLVCVALVLLVQNV